MSSTGTTSSGSAAAQPIPAAAAAAAAATPGPGSNGGAPQAGSAGSTATRHRASDGAVGTGIPGLGSLKAGGHSSGGDTDSRLPHVHTSNGGSVPTAPTILRTSLDVPPAPRRTSSSLSGSPNGSRHGLLSMVSGAAAGGGSHAHQGSGDRAHGSGGSNVVSGSQAQHAPGPTSTGALSTGAASGSERQPTMSQQLLNKLKLKKKPPLGGPQQQQQQQQAAAAASLINASHPSLAGGIAGGSATSAAAPAQVVHGFAINNTGDSDVEEFAPGASAPTNPLAPLLTPFRMMRPLVPAVASRATAAAVAGIKRPWQRRAAAAAAATGGGSVKGGGVMAGLAPTLSGRIDCNPPMGYLWLWMGSFRRWQRRFFVASEAPGVLLIYKRMNMKGKVSSISLRNAGVDEDPVDPRQFKIVTPTGLIYLRTLVPEERTRWVACLRESISLYLKNQTMVEELKDKGLLPGMMGMGAGAVQGGAGSVTAALPGILPEVSELDAEQRRRIRTLVAERLADVVPYQQEVERHMSALSMQLLGVVSSLNIRMPPLTPTNSMLKLSSFTASQGARQHQPSPLWPGFPTGQQQEPGSAPTPGGLETGSPVLGGSPVASLPTHASQPVSQQQDTSAHQVQAELSTHSVPTPVLGGSAAGGERGTPLPNAFISSRIRTRNTRCANLPQAYGQFLEAVRYALHAEAVRIVQLESENMALQRTVALLKQQQSRMERPRHTRSMGGSAALGRGPGAGGVGAAGQGGAGVSEGEEEEDAVSVMTADEDAFDVTEPFDEGVDYGILDEPDATIGGPESGPAGAAAKGRRVTGSGRLAASAKAAAAGAEAGSVHKSALDAARASVTGMGGAASSVCEELEEDECLEEEDDDEDAVDSEAEEAEVLNALEVVRQVEYVEKLHISERFTQAVAAQEPPSTAPPAAGITDTAAEDDEEEEEEEEEQPKTRRSRLPAPRPLGRGFSLWSMLKNMIGKDLTRITMPATINEPTSTLQRIAEGMEYVSLLDRAAQEPNSLDRIMLVAVWTATAYAGQSMRECKPFNPLLGETYEWQSLDGQNRYVCEQVSHHPPVLAYIADNPSEGWEVQGELETKTKFWGNTAEVLLYGTEALRLAKFGEEYRWNRGTICVHDIIFGNYWPEVYGKIKVTNGTTGEHAVYTLKPCKKRLTERGKLEGSTFDAAGNEIWRISGSIADKIYAELTPTAAKARGLAAPPAPQLVWQKEPYPEDAALQYGFTQFCIGLNDPTDPIVSHLPPTDTRFRPDQRALEVGEWNRATSEKLRLEEKQRRVRRERAALGMSYEPLWFEQVDHSTLTHLPEQHGFAWKWNGDYWKRRQGKDWAMCPDLYSTTDQVLTATSPKPGVAPASP